MRTVFPSEIVVGTSPPEERIQPLLCLLNGFRLVGPQGSVPLTQSAQRLLAFLALRGHEIHRSKLAGVLWPDASESRSRGSLRSTLWRLPDPGKEAVEALGETLKLAGRVSVDIGEARQLASRVIDPSIRLPKEEPIDRMVEVLSAELLPDWYEDWVLIEAERWRQLRLHALEVLAERLMAHERYAEAMLAALAAVDGEPLRESGHAILMRIHIAEDNRSEAIAEFDHYRRLLDGELGVEPTDRLGWLLRDFLPGKRLGLSTT